jgi:hypothetical protein
MWPAGEEVIEPGEEVEAGTKKTKQWRKKM